MEKDYEINPVTIAIVAEKMNGAYVSKVIEISEDGTYYVKGSPGKLIDAACKYFGSSLKGRQEGARTVCGIKHKVPISIDPSSGMYFFPTSSPQNPYCSWISHTHVDRIRKAPGRGTEFIFKNGMNLILEVSYGSMINQLQRTAQFRYQLEKRLNATPPQPRPDKRKDDDFFVLT
ncbi:competence protein ComK [Paraliobacillus sediminis]|uniref:competence protein ComK n=1 Tax=Paraliobacillus sediminis TaxID=1885916 RepID=UPI000E3BB587|nr:competence protein ComK [Paraliobacillus sediminis]